MTSFSEVTELPGAPFPAHAFSMLQTRYAFARAHCPAGSDVLEIGCGGGAGLGYLAAHGARVTGVDIDEAILDHPRRHYTGRDGITVRQADAEALPFEDASFDTVLIFEAIYYFPDFPKVLAECKRILRPGGTLLLVTVNPEWPAFNPSPHSVAYYPAATLDATLRAAGYTPTFQAGFPDDEGGFVRKMVSLLKRVAVRCRLMPKTMRGKVLLKRIFFGTLQPYPHELADGMGTIEPLVDIDPQAPCTRYINLYVTARAES